MKNIFRKMVLILILLASLYPVCAQAGAPVFDITNLYQAIEDSYTFYQQLQAMIETMKNSVEQINLWKQKYTNIYKEYKGLYDSFASGARKPNSIDDFYRNYFEVMDTVYGNADEILNTTESIQKYLAADQFHFGSFSYSYNDLFQKDTYSNLLQEAMDYINIDGSGIKEGGLFNLTKQLTREQKADFYRHYGLTPEHYMAYAAIGDAISETTIEVAAKVNTAAERAVNKREKNKQEKEQFEQTENSVEQEIFEYGQIQEINETLDLVYDTLNSMIELTTQKLKQEQLKEQSEMEMAQITLQVPSGVFMPDLNDSSTGTPTEAEYGKLLEKREIGDFGKFDAVPLFSIGGAW